LVMWNPEKELKDRCYYNSVAQIGPRGIR